MRLPVIRELFLDGWIYRNEAKRILANTGWLFIDKVIRMALNVIVAIWIARYLGPEQFGVFNYAQAYVTLFTAIATLGIDGIVVRDIVNENSNKYEILGTAFVLKILAGVIAFLLTIITSLFFMVQTKMFYLTLILAIGMIIQSIDVIDFWFQSQIKSKYVVCARNLSFIILSVTKIILIIDKANIIAFGITVTIEIFIASIGLIYFYVKTSERILNWSFKLNRANQLLKDGLPLIISNILVILFLKTDQIMIGLLSNFSQVGLYSSAIRIVEIWAFVPNIILSSIYPLMVRIKNTNIKSYNIKNQQLFTLFFVLSIFIIVSSFMLSNSIIFNFFGTEFIDSYRILVILSIFSIFTFSGALRAQIFIINNITRFHSYSALIGLFTLVPLNFILIPSYGSNGAAVSTVIAYFFSAIVSSFLFKETRYIGKMQVKAFLFLIK